MRTNGFEKPFSRDQATSWVVQLVLIGVCTAHALHVLVSTNCDLHSIFSQSFIAFVSALLSWEKVGLRSVCSIDAEPRLSHLSFSWLQCLAILLPNAVLVFIVLSAWIICESRDPAKPVRIFMTLCLDLSTC